MGSDRFELIFLVFKGISGKIIKIQKVFSELMFARLCSYSLNSFNLKFRY